MIFTSTLIFPENIHDIIKTQNEENKVRANQGKEPLNSLMQVQAVKQYGFEELLNPLMDGWELTSFDGDGFKLQLDFTNPLFISTDDEPDILLIQLNLGEFVDKNGQNMPESIVKYIQIPTQMES